jgi:hypothetical protein
VDVYGVPFSVIRSAAAGGQSGAADRPRTRARPARARSLAIRFPVVEASLRAQQNRSGLTSIRSGGWCWTR